MIVAIVFIQRHFVTKSKHALCDQRKKRMYLVRVFPKFGGGLQLYYVYFMITTCLSSLIFCNSPNLCNNKVSASMIRCLSIITPEPR